MNLQQAFLGLLSAERVFAASKGLQDLPALNPEVRMRPYREKTNGWASSPWCDSDVCLGARAWPLLHAEQGRTVAMCSLQFLCGPKAAATTTGRSSNVQQSGSAPI